MKISVSTPLYGIGVDSKEATTFLDYLESWVKHYERIDRTLNVVPVIELAFWNKDDNVSTFKKNYIGEKDDQNKLELINRYSQLLCRLKELDKKERIKLSLYFTERSDARIFMAHDIGNNIFSGLFAMFTPINFSAIENEGWELTGFSFSEESSYSDTNNFYKSLTTTDYKYGRKNEKSLLESPKDWLINHYGLNQKKD